MLRQMGRVSIDHMRLDMIWQSSRYKPWPCTLFLYLVSTGFRVAASGKFVNVDQVRVVTWVYGSVSGCVYAPASSYMPSFYLISNTKRLEKWMMKSTSSLGLNHDWFLEMRQMLLPTEYERRINFTSTVEDGFAKSSEFGLSIVLTYMSFYDISWCIYVICSYWECTD